MDNTSEVTALRGPLVVSLWSVAGVVGVGSFVLVELAIRVREEGRRERPQPADTAIILGAYTDGYRPSRPLINRLRAGLHLYRRGYVRFIIVSGGKGVDELVSEARSMKRYLMANGVPADVILEERHSTDTRENLLNSKGVMESLGLRSCVVVTSDYHLPRALAVARRLSMKATGFAAVSRRDEFRFAIREVLAGWSYAFLGYSDPRKG